MNILDDLGIDPDDFHWKDLAACKNSVKIIIRDEYGDVIDVKPPGEYFRLYPGQTQEVFDPLFDKYESDSAPYPLRHAVDEMCQGCPVRQECLKEGMENDGFGVWGGFYLSWGKIDQAMNSHKDWSVWNELSLYK